MRARASASLVVLLLLTLFAQPAASDVVSDFAVVSGVVGEHLDPDAASSDLLRYVGSPAPRGYSHAYQWGDPMVGVLSPSGSRVHMTATLDLTGRVAGSTALLGLLDTRSLAAGQVSPATGVYLAIMALPDGRVEIGPSDGAADGVVSRTVFSLSAEEADAADALMIDIIVDGAADPGGCAAGPVGDAEGCISITLPGRGTVADSYGAITAAGYDEELAGPATPGWEAMPGGSTGIGFVLFMVEGRPLISREDCRGNGHLRFGFTNLGQCMRQIAVGG